MIRRALLYWFKIQTNKSAKEELEVLFDQIEVKNILHKYWIRYQILKQDVPTIPTLGGSLMVHLAAMSTAFYRELRERGLSENNATQTFFNIAWKVYKKMGTFTWHIAGIYSRNDHKRLLYATKLFRKFPFNSPSYQWEDIPSKNNIVGFNCIKCPVAEYFKSQGLSKFCASTWCALDYPLAELWNARLERNGSIAGGAPICDFRWTESVNEK